ncbi:MULTISPECIES: YbaN family protein [Pseudovibrio]|uniref:YbaN family protein n=1 Tax=Stappiaceae TaxID=2821832 RepID=UPI002365D2E4|nr:MULTISPECIES: YbaN family protein [Pseudovibrio]MDD7908697.1 YbaN family protein [Pseudovibrio exalbescens]MDX5592770.1 YbaN family protein [Pseudovibrio sp. SPO723]
MPRTFYMIAGILLVGIGLIGIVLPLLPSTIFFILATGCFARSNPRLEKWLLNHPKFGKSVRDWQDHGAISVKGKLMAVFGMTVGYAVFVITTAPSMLLAIIVLAVLVACASYVVTRPSGSRTARAS